MSTRSIVALPLDSGFRGRYCHDDGYPSWMARTLHALIRREGVETVRRVLTEEHSVWWHLYVDEERGRQIAEGLNEMDTFLPGWGTHAPAKASDPDWWIGNDGSDDGTEWAYVLNDTHLSILQRLHRDESPAVGMLGFNDPSGHWKHVGDLQYDQDIDDDYLAKAECGEHYERCVHVVEAHIKDAPEAVRRMGMRTYVGHDPRGWEEIGEVWLKGKWWRHTRSGSTGTATSHDWRDLDRSKSTVRYWWAVVKNGEDSTQVRLARILTRGAHKLEYRVKLMPTATQPEQIIEKGAVL